MGMYFGIINHTRHMGVGRPWKNQPPCAEDMASMVHYFGWQIGDIISAACYCETYFWNWQTQEWIFFQEGDEDPLDKLPELYTFPQVFDFIPQEAVCKTPNMKRVRTWQEDIEFELERELQCTLCGCMSTPYSEWKPHKNMAFYRA